MKRIIISLSGQKGSGKSTVSNYLVEKYNFVEESFAKPLKDCLSLIFCWDREMLEGIGDLRNIREQIDEWWSNKLNIGDFSPRKAMTLIGTDLMRNFFNENIWIYSLEKRLEKYDENKNIVVTDCRFVNEIEFLRSKNAVTILVDKQSSHDLHWKELAKRAKKGDKKSLEKLNELNIHVSEWDLIDYHFDFVIENTGTVENLYCQIDQILEKISKNKS